MKFFVKNLNGILDDVIPHLDVVDTINEADRVVAWQDIDEEYVGIYSKAFGFHKPSFLMSHCYGSCNHYVKPNPYIPLAGKYLVWGQFDYDLAKKAGMADKTVITGCPIFGHVKPRVPHEGTVICFAPRHCGFDTDESKLIAEELRKYPAKVITKTLAEHTYSYDNPVKTKRGTIEHIDSCYEVLSQSDVVVVNDPISTFALLAFSAGIPVISVVENDTDFNEFNQSIEHVKDVLKPGMTQTTISNLLKTIDSVLLEDTKKEQRESICEYMGVSIKDPVQNILNELNK